MPLKTSDEIEEKVEERREKREQAMHPVYPDPTLLFRMEKGAKYFGLIMHALSKSFPEVTFHFDEHGIWLADSNPTGVLGVYLTLKLETLTEYNIIERDVSLFTWKTTEFLKYIKKGEPLELLLHGNEGYVIVKIKRGTFKISVADNDEAHVKKELRERVDSMVYPIEFYSKGADWRMAVKTFKIFKPDKIRMVSDGEKVFLRVVADDLSNDEGEIELAVTKSRLIEFDHLFPWGSMADLLEFFPTDVLIKINEKGALLFYLDALSFSAVLMMAGADEEEEWTIEDEEDEEFKDI